MPSRISNQTLDFRCLTLLLILVLAGPASSRTIAVPEQARSIGVAMARANPGDIILVSCGTYYEHDILVKPGVSLWSGTLQPDCVTIDAQGRGRVLVISECDTTTAVVGFTLKGGRHDGDGGAISCRDASPRIARCVIRDNRARRGGGLAVSGDRGPQVEDCVFTANEADLLGGGILWSGRGSLSRCDLTANVALTGGGLACLDGDGLILDQCNLEQNEAASSGGGFWLAAGSPELRRCLIARNHGGLGGGGLACQAGQPRLVACTLADNQVEAAGGAMLLQAASSSVERSILAFNEHEPVATTGDLRCVLSGCVVFGHVAGDWIGPLAGQAGQAGNFSQDPRFCARERGRYELRAGSPCLPGARDGRTSRLIGARDRGCE